MRIRDAQDAASWRTFADAYAPLICRYSRRRGLQDADADDVTREVLAEVARCVRTFEYRPERGRFRDWLGTLTCRRVWRLLQRQGRGGAAAPGQALDEQAGPPPDGEWVAEFNAGLLRGALERVRPHCTEATWRMFERVWLEGRSAVATPTCSPCRSAPSTTPSRGS
jgi:RNA polymerase sigma-70 factor (ECF subfamily)